MAKAKLKEQTLTDVRQVLFPVRDGQYNGTQSGALVTFSTPDAKYSGLTPVGGRGLDIPCIVTSLKGKVTVREARASHGR